MTFSILVRHQQTGHFGGAAATGNLCVGAWVLRGDALAGMTASQGLYPNPFWSPQVLSLMSAGDNAPQALRSVVDADPGCDLRQLAVLDRDGGTAVHSGVKNIDYYGHIAADGLMVVGNMLESRAVLEAIADTYFSATTALPDRLIAALSAGASAGGDFRGLVSAALLVVAADEPPLDLRIDAASDPLRALEDLYRRTLDPAYRDWLHRIPTIERPRRVR